MIVLLPIVGCLLEPWCVRGQIAYKSFALLEGFENEVKRRY